MSSLSVFGADRRAQVPVATETSSDPAAETRASGIQSQRYRPKILPSRTETLRTAEAALGSGRLIYVTGDEGSGRSTFSTELLIQRAQSGRSVRRIVGSPALSEVPLAALAAAGLLQPFKAGPSSENAQHRPVALVIADLVEQLSRSSFTILIDGAEYLDEASSGVIQHLALASRLASEELGEELGEYAGEEAVEYSDSTSEQSLEIIVTGLTDPGRLPSGIRELVFDRDAKQIRLQAMDMNDARALLRGLFGRETNAGSANRLLNLSGGNPMHLRELVIDARAAGALVDIDGFTTLRAGWMPGSQRISTLMSRRLNKYDADIREAIECVAVVGELSLSAGNRLFEQRVIDLAIDEGLLELSAVVSDLDIAQSFDGPGAGSISRSGTTQLLLASGLTPELVLAGLGRKELRDRVARIRTTLSRELLTATARLHLTHHLRRLQVPLDFGELREDAEAALAAGLTDMVLVLTDDLPVVEFENSVGVDVSAQSSTPAQSSIAALRLLRADALSDLGNAELALAELDEMLAANSSEAVLRAARIEFEGLGLEKQAKERLSRYLTEFEGAAQEGARDIRALLTLLRTRSELPVDIDALELAAEDDRVSPDLRLRLLSYLIAERVHSGDPAAGVHIFSDHLDGDVWQRATASSRGEFMQAMFAAMLGDGASLRAFDHHFSDIEWADLSLDHAKFLSGRGLIFLEAGDAIEAARLFSQASGLLSMRDPDRLAGFTAGVESAAAAMLGDRERAEMLLARWEAAPVLSGGLSRVEAERATLVSALLVRGTAAARANFETLASSAEQAHRPHTLMRLLHDGWRLRLVEPEDENWGLHRLTLVSGSVRGELAGLLRHYEAALSEVAGQGESGPGHSEDGSSGAAGTLTVEGIVRAHLQAGRPLYAAELAARSAELATEAGNRVRASRLLDLFADAVLPLGNVNTPSLGRARVDGSLSEREREVCERAASGLSNAEIAAELFLSTRTVEGHLQRAYSKLGITDRRQLIAAQ